jgi:L-ribulose-5-phosphate 3-epimerase UlaE
MSLFSIRATQQDVQRKLDILHFITMQGISECTAFDTDLSSEFMAIADKIDAMHVKNNAPRCVDCDCAWGGTDCYRKEDDNE